jgi:urocanate hydratase
MVDFWNAGVPTLDYGNNIRQVAPDEGLENVYLPDLCPPIYAALFCRGINVSAGVRCRGPRSIYKTMPV